MNDEDEVFLHLAAGTDLPTAYAASLPDDRPPAPAVDRRWSMLGILAGIAIVLVWCLLK